MLFLYKKENDQLGQKVLDYLEDNCLNYKIIEINDKSFLKDNEQEFKKESEIFNHLRKYTRLMKTQSEYSSDACYIDPESGEVC